MSSKAYCESLNHLTLVLPLDAVSDKVECTNSSQVYTCNSVFYFICFAKTFASIRCVCVYTLCPWNLSSRPLPAVVILCMWTNDGECVIIYIFWTCVSVLHTLSLPPALPLCVVNRPKTKRKEEANSKRNICIIRMYLEDGAAQRVLRLYGIYVTCECDRSPLQRNLQHFDYMKRHIWTKLYRRVVYDCDVLRVNINRKCSIYTEKEVKNKQHEKKGKQRKVIRLMWIHTLEEKCGERKREKKRNERNSNRNRI